MPADDSPSSAVLEALGYALFVCDDAGVIRLAGDAPEWLARLWPAAASRGSELPLHEASPFLENFLIDARECWSADLNRHAESGPWVEREPAGAEVHLQARAMTAGGRACLLVERLGEAFSAQVAVLQKARETVIAMQRLDAEIQKKEILVHCLTGDLSGSLGNIVTSLRLIELEQNSARTGQLLNLAMRSAQEQRSVIDKVLGLFPEELTGLYGGTDGTAAPAGVHRAVQVAVGNVAEFFSEKDVRLATPDALDEALKVVAERAHLERIIGNLLRHALEHTPSGGEVIARVADEADAAVVSIEFPGEDVTVDEDDAFALRSEPSSAPSSEAFLRLRFCRIAVEGCHGEMGFRSLAGGGTCAWVRLPKWSGAE